jgi:uncharacterized protein
MRRLLILLYVVLTGCTDFMAQRGVEPPLGRVASALNWLLPEGHDVTELRVPVGPPETQLAVWVMKPAQEAKGTILLLHGFLADHHQVEGAAESLREAGYRAVMVDLRGHGQTQADQITYGVVEARDLTQLTTYLQEHHLCGKTVGVFGTSYGAATAIQFAGSDPRVKAVVAVAPFASLREEVPHVAKMFAPIPGLFMSDQDFTEVVAAMGRYGGFDPEAANAVAAIRKTSARVRLFHGTWDLVNPCAASKEIAVAAPEHTELTLMPGEGHLWLCFDLFGELRAETRGWFDRYLAEETEQDKSKR